MRADLLHRGWCELTFLNIARDLKRGPFGGNLKKEIFVPSGYKVYEQQHAINHDYSLGTYYIDEDKYEELNGFAVGNGDYIISCSGTIGKLYRLPKEAPNGVINQALLKITLEDRILYHSYFSHLFQSEFFQRQILSDARGTGMQNLAGMKEIKIVPVQVPPLPEQRKIVEKIDKLISDIDNGVANLKAAKDKLEIYRQAVLKKAFEGELTKEWRVKNTGFDSAQPAEQARSLSGAEATDLPEGWEKVKLGDVCELNPKHENKNFLTDDFEVQFVPMALVDEVINNINLVEIRRFSEVQNKSYTYFADNDVIFAKVTPCMENGKIAVAKKLKNGIGYGSSEFHVFRCDYLLKNNYLFYFLVQSVFRRDAQRAMTGAVGLRRVPKKYLEDYKIPLPPLSEQHQIVTEIETRLSVCDNILATIDEALEKSEALRQSVLKMAFEGRLLSEAELEACRKEADWEPAYKLLERIKVEKEAGNGK